MSNLTKQILLACLIGFALGFIIRTATAGEPYWELCHSNGARLETRECYRVEVPKDGKLCVQISEPVTPIKTSTGNVVSANNVQREMFRQTVMQPMILH